MRNMSFSLTTEQIRARTKTVTRRIGWEFVKPGDLVRAVVKCQGLKKGEKVEPLTVLRIVDVRREPLRRLTDDITYGFLEIIREGFGDHPTLRWPSEFVAFFCGSHRVATSDRAWSYEPPRVRQCTPDDEVTRIEFTYADADDAWALGA